MVLLLGVGVLDACAVVVSGFGAVDGAAADAVVDNAAAGVTVISCAQESAAAGIFAGVIGGATFAAKTARPIPTMTNAEAAEIKARRFVAFASVVP